MPRGAASAHGYCGTSPSVSPARLFPPGHVQTFRQSPSFADSGVSLPAGRWHGRRAAQPPLSGRTRGATLDFPPRPGALCLLGQVTPGSGRRGGGAVRPAGKAHWRAALRTKAPNVPGAVTARPRPAAHPKPLPRPGRAVDPTDPRPLAAITRPHRCFPRERKQTRGARALLGCSAELSRGLKLWSLTGPVLSDEAL